jgi:hypothetical protein
MLVSWSNQQYCTYVGSHGMCAHEARAGGHDDDPGRGRRRIPAPLSSSSRGTRRWEGERGGSRARGADIVRRLIVRTQRCGRGQSDKHVRPREEATRSSSPANEMLVEHAIRVF